LRFGLAAEDYQGVLQYTQLREIDRDGGWALLTAPNRHLCAAVQTRLREPIQAALRVAANTALRVVVVVAAVRGIPTLAQLQAEGKLGPAADAAPTFAPRCAAGKLGTVADAAPAVAPRGAAGTQGAVGEAAFVRPATFGPHPPERSAPTLTRPAASAPRPPAPVAPVTARATARPRSTRHRKHAGAERRAS
jgi:hypothetical protein